MQIDLTKKTDDPVVIEAEKKARGKVSETKPPVIVYDDALKSECRKFIDDEFIEAGGDYREDQKGAVYWLDLPHLLAFEQADREIIDDREFWSWFKEYRSKSDLEAKRSRVKWNRYWSDKDFVYSGPKRDYFTGWWSGWNTECGLVNNSPFGGNTARLAVAVGAVQSIVSVINDTGRAFRVKLADSDTPEQPSSFTEFGSRIVVVSPQALLDTSLVEDVGIQVTAGWGLHEASHVKWSSSIIGVLALPTKLKPVSIAGLLLNLIEDVRIEVKTGQGFPGFVDYFNIAGTYLWGITRQHAPKKFGPELGDKMNFITGTVKWPTEYAEFLAHVRDKQVHKEFEWFKRWTDKYRMDDSNPRALLIEALLHLQEDEETKKQIQDHQQKEDDDNSTCTTTQFTSDKEFRDFIKRLRAGMKGGNPIETCPSPGRGTTNPLKPINLTPEQASQIDKLIRENLEIRDPIVKMVDMLGLETGPKVASLKPEETEESKFAYKRPGPMVSKLRSAFVFRKTDPTWAEKLQRSGSIDEDQLWRIAGYDFKIFERKVEPDIPSTTVTMLVDMSGSMSGRRIDDAQELANTMLECLKSMKGVKVRIRGHTTPMTRYRLPGLGTADDTMCQIFRLWEPGDPMTRLGLISTCEKGWNYDGFAIDWCARELVDVGRVGEDKVLIVLSDGKPNARGYAYSGGPAMDHVRKVTETWARKGVTVFQIAIDPEVRSSDQARMYRHWIQYGNDLPMRLTRLLIKLFGGASA